jgi:hypothetical protein
MIVALMFSAVSAFKQPVNGSMVWEETVADQQRKGYHPSLRFSSWEITRFNMSTTYMFVTPQYIQQGQFEVHGNRYTFRAVMANDFENADIAKLMANMDPESARTLGQNYAKSMQNFEGEYDKDRNTLTVTYPVEGRPTAFELHPYTDGDDKLTMVAGSDERPYIGLWHAPEPFPDRLDARVRYKIGDIDGLRQFGKEAGASEGAQFGLLDLRPDLTFRIHSKVGNWQRSGSTLSLILEGKQIDYAISPDGTKLLARGKPAYVRN